MAKPLVAPPEDSRAGLRHLAIAALCMAVISSLSYLNGAFYRFRPWVSGEPLPVVRMFAGSKPQLPGFAEAGLLDGQGPEDLDESLGAAVASNLDEEDEPAVGEAPPEEQTESVDAGAGEAGAPAVRIRPEEYQGLAREIENPEALARFFDKLERTARKQPNAITRVAHYGDSSVAADAITRTARRHLQRRFGDAGHGFILISRGDMHYAHHDIRHRSTDDWEMLSLVRDQLRSGYYGYGGVQARGSWGQRAWFATSEDARVGGKASRFELYFQRFKRGGKVRLRVDREVRATVDTEGKNGEDGFYTVEVEDGPHEFDLKALGGGQLRLYGVVIERDVPGVVYDSLGLVGARAERLLNADPAHMKRQLSHRDADLLVLGFGGNEAGNKWLKLDHYEKDLTKVVETMRAGDPGMDCLLFGPLDQGERDTRGRIVTLETLPKIVEVQRRVAKAQGCAFFDTFAAMGGENSSRRWYKSRPRLMTSDLRHATPKGYQVIGKLYYKALLKSFADHLGRD